MNDGILTDNKPLWWRDGVIYQIYPRSFRDSNGDGVGDLTGILQKLDYLADLGIDGIWISPFYPSPMADFGYDVADYTGVDPIFGTLADFDALIAAIHRRGMKLILDFVPNHTSEQHPWFVESRSSRTNPKRDWYLWRDPAPDGGPPTNWTSQFGGSAWTLDETTGQYYCHSFLKQQPDLNWRNPDVRKAIYDAMRFWLERGENGVGVDGFRMDVLWLLIKDDQFRDNPPNPDWHEGDSSSWKVLPKYTADQPETHQIVAEMRRLMDSYSAPGKERVLIGEIYLPLPELIVYYGSGTEPGAQMPFNFRLIQTGWNADHIAQLIQEYEYLLKQAPAGAWPNWVLGNHDQRRLASRIGAAQARVAAVMLLTLRGTPTLYYADELGMPDAWISPSQIQDPAEKNQPGLGQGRDPERAPMLWNNSTLAGFTTGKPWLPFAGDPTKFSVEAENRDPHSILTLYKRLLQLRRANLALYAGEVQNITTNSGVLGYMRGWEVGSRFQVLLNLTNQTQTAEFPVARVVLSSYLDRDDEINDKGTAINLRPNEALILQF